MRKPLFFVTALVFVLALGAAAIDYAHGSVVAPLSANDDPQTPPPPPPQNVSPADPSIDPPDAGGWVCPRCGAEIPGPMGRHKGPLGRPQLAPDAGRRGNHRHEWGAGDGCCQGHGLERGREAHRQVGHAGFFGQGPRRGVPAEGMLRHSNELNLSEEQIVRLEGLANQTKMKLIDLHAEIEKGELEIQNLLRSGSDDLARIKRQLGAISRARTEIQEARITNLFEARRVLTVEQKGRVKREFPRLGAVLD